MQRVLNSKPKFDKAIFGSERFAATYKEAATKAQPKLSESFEITDEVPPVSLLPLEAVALPEAVELTEAVELAEALPLLAEAAAL